MRRRNLHHLPPQRTIPGPAQARQDTPEPEAARTERPADAPCLGHRKGGPAPGSDAARQMKAAGTFRGSAPGGAKPAASKPRRSGAAPQR